MKPIIFVSLICLAPVLFAQDISVKSEAFKNLNGAIAAATKMETISALEGWKKVCDAIRVLKRTQKTTSADDIEHIGTLLNALDIEVFDDRVKFLNELKALLEIYDAIVAIFKIIDETDAVPPMAMAAAAAAAAEATQENRPGRQSPRSGSPFGRRNSKVKPQARTAVGSPRPAGERTAIGKVRSTRLISSAGM